VRAFFWIDKYQQTVKVMKFKPIAKFLLNARLLSLDIVRYLSFKFHPNAPIIFANSFPKSGTNLLIQILSGFAEISLFHINTRGVILTYERDTGEKRAEMDILAEIRDIYPGEIGWGHLHGTPAISSQLIQDDFINFFLYRDPRDVVVSHAYYVTNKKNGHIHHDYYQNTLTSMEERISTSILGLPHLINEFPDIGKRFAPYRPWLDCPEVMKIKFEDLIHDQERVLRKMLEHIEKGGYSLAVRRSKALKHMKDAINPASSRTFRRGTTGEWRNYFSAEHKEIFKSVTGSLLIDLGYEVDDQW